MRDHWIIFGTGMLIFKTFPFFKYYFGLKVFGTSMWTWTVWTRMNRFIAKACRRNEYMVAQKTGQDVMTGEDAIVSAMQRFANDSKCVDHLSCFKVVTEDKIGAFKKAPVLQMKDELSERATKQLQAVAQFEAGMGSALQELVLREAAKSFREEFPNNQDMQDKAFSAELKSLSGAQLQTSDDPVSAHFDGAFQSLAGANLSSIKGNASGSIAERVAYAQQMKELEFQQAFMVNPAVASEVRKRAAEAGKDFDLSSFPLSRPSDWISCM